MVREYIVKIADDVTEDDDVLYGKPAKELIRCKDCKYGQKCTDGKTTYQCFKWNSGEFGELHEQNWFCADGQR